MKLAFLSLVYILTHTLVAKGQQLATINDADGFTNVRAGSSITAKIVGKFYDGDVFTYENEQDGWVKILYWPADSPENRSFEGYIHKDRLLPLDHLRSLLENDKASINGHLTIRNDSISVRLVTTPFKPKQHVLQKDKGGMIETIDGRRPLGTDGEMPLEKMVGLRMTIGRDSVDIPAAAWNNLYDPTLETCHIFGDTRTGFIYAYLQSNRSAAGGYEIVWVFKDGRFVKRYVDQSEN